MSNKNNELNFLSYLEDGKETTQKNISNNISVSIGFINALIKKFLKKGVIKIKQAPYKRFIYYLTPQGFSEKARLVNEYFNDSLFFFKSLRLEFNKLFSEDLSSGYYLYGTGEVCEIAILSAKENKKKIISIIDPSFKKKKYLDFNVLKKIPKNLEKFKIVITTSSNQQALFFKLKKLVRIDKILFVKSMCISIEKPSFKATKIKKKRLS